MNHTDHSVNTIVLGILVVAFLIAAWAMAQGIGEAFGAGVVERLVP